MADYLTYQDIIDAVELQVKQSGGSKENLIKMVVNMVYLDEIMVCDPLHPLFWMIDFKDNLASVGEIIITGITAASPPVVTAASHGLTTGNLISIYQVAGMTEVNRRVFYTTRLNADSFSLQDLDGTNIDGSGFTAYTSGGIALHRGTTISSPDIQKFLVAAWDDEKKMDPIASLDIENDQTLLDDSSSRPKRYFHRKKYLTTGTEINQIIWMPGADDAYNLRYWFEKRPSRLAAAATDVPELPPQFHDAIVSGAVMRLAEFNVQVENQIVWPVLYERQLEALKVFNRKWWESHKQFESPYMI